MARVEKKLKWTDDKFKRRIGTTKPVFLLMLDILQTVYDKLHQSGGKPPDLTVGDKLLITTLKYYREYMTIEFLADGRFQWRNDRYHSTSQSVFTT